MRDYQPVPFAEAGKVQVRLQGVSELKPRAITVEDCDDMPKPEWIIEATKHRTDWTIEELYDLVCGTPSDISEHLPLLRDLVIEHCDSVTEFGMRHGVSTIALLAGGPCWLTSYDLVPSPMATLLMRADEAFSFIEGDSRNVTIRPTDLLFIDTVHTYAQLHAELTRHADKVAKYIVLHDTATYGEVGEDGGPGLDKAVSELIERGRWEVQEHHRNNNGLTVLRRTGGTH